MTKKQMLDYLVNKYDVLMETKSNMLNASKDDKYDVETRAHYYEFYRSYRSKCILMEQIVFDMFGVDLFDLWLES